VIEHYHQRLPIDLGTGNPDMPTPPQIVEELVETVNKPGTRRCSDAKGNAGLRKAQAAYYVRPFGLKLDAVTYHWPGWRMGFAVGNERPIAILARVKLYLGYGTFTVVQVAAAAALNDPRGCIDKISQTYRGRRDCLIASFLRADLTPAAIFTWAPIPDHFRETSSVEFAKLILEKADVDVSPGARFGEGYVHRALVENEHCIRQRARDIKRLLAQPRLQNVSDQ
jgi:aspartate/methionine/tyrosine aminotransferase